MRTRILTTQPSRIILTSFSRLKPHFSKSSSSASHPIHTVTSPFPLKQPHQSPLRKHNQKLNYPHHSHNSPILRPFSLSTFTNMAYTTRASSNPSLITSLRRLDIITSEEVEEAMLAVDRGDYVPGYEGAGGIYGEGGTGDGCVEAYMDCPLSIGWKATISAPHMHAMALEYLGGSNSLFPLSGKRVLDIGSGSGYLTACLAELVFPSAPLPNQEKEGEEGMVVGIDHITGLRDMALRNFPKRERGRRCLESGKVKFVVGDGRRGWVGDGLGYDAIHVGAAAVTVHEALIEQLRSPGRIFIPVQDTNRLHQHIYVIDKDADGMVTRTKLCGVNYVPLTDAPR